MFEEYLFPILLFAGIGFGSAILLTIFSNLFSIKTDSRIADIDEKLPQANCGACGYAGCEDYAKAIIEQGAETNLCKVGGEKTAAVIAQIMGKPAPAFHHEIAVVHCHGTCDKAPRKFKFDGIQTCTSAKRYFGGTNACIYGCIGLGDCQNVCQYDAIRIIDGIANIQPGMCRACGACAAVCPNHLISLRPTAKHFDIRCSSQDTPKNTKTACEVGCLSCRLCEKKCENDAIHIENQHAVIDYSKCTNCGICATVCPTHAICNCEVTD